MNMRAVLAALLAACLWLAALPATAAFADEVGPVIEGSPMLLPVDPVPLVARTAKGDVSFSVEIAEDPGERAAGLMFRKSMPDDRGMLFVFEETQPVSFWMQNTPMPLDLVFVGQDGRVRAVLPGEPFSEALIAPADPVRFVLELKRGTADRYAITPGTELDHPAISEVRGAANQP